MSPITMASAAKSCGRVGGYVENALPISSWPSITSLIPTGGLPFHARSAPTCMRMFDFESALPRPKMAPSRSVASNGGDSHFDSSPTGTTS